MNLDKIRILSRFIKDETQVIGRRVTKERCPKCSVIGQDFRIIDEFSLACLVCGTHFDRKEFLEELRPKVKEIIEKQEEIYYHPNQVWVVSETKDLNCSLCGYTAKSFAGKVTHERHCAKRRKTEATGQLLARSANV